MADVKTVDEGTQFPEKRKLDLPGSMNKAIEEDEDKADSNKKQKIETPSEKNGSASLSGGENVAELEEHLNVNASVDVKEEREEDEEDEEDYNAEKNEDENDDVNEETENADRKGKGVMLHDKGKGKMLEDSEDDDSDSHDDDNDDDSSDDSDSDISDGFDESDMEDDPLAEVDLDNILPSRTRQGRVQHGVRIFSNPDKARKTTWILLAVSVWCAVLRMLLHDGDCEFCLGSLMGDAQVSISAPKFLKTPLPWLGDQTLLV